jgi:hypothetical protein
MNSTYEHAIDLFFSALVARGPLPRYCRSACCIANASARRSRKSVFARRARPSIPTPSTQAARLARQRGFVGAFCIDPSQVATMNTEFSPSRDELSDARSMIAAFDAAAREGGGAGTGTAAPRAAPTFNTSEDFMIQPESTSPVCDAIVIVGRDNMPQANLVREPNRVFSRLAIAVSR